MPLDCHPQEGYYGMLPPVGTGYPNPGKSGFLHLSCVSRYLDSRETPAPPFTEIFPWILLHPSAPVLSRDWLHGALVVWSQMARATHMVLEGKFQFCGRTEPGSSFRGTSNLLLKSKFA